MPNMLPHGQGAMDSLAADELGHALLAQDSVVVQMLLEAALPCPQAAGAIPGTFECVLRSDKDRSYPSLSSGVVEEAGLTAECQSLLASAIHTMFLRQPLLAKLVHFQARQHARARAHTHVQTHTLCFSGSTFCVFEEL